jgi:hypothetical protein
MCTGADYSRCSATKPTIRDWLAATTTTVIATQRLSANWPNGAPARRLGAEAVSCCSSGPEFRPRR